MRTSSRGTCCSRWRTSPPRPETPCNSSSDLRRRITRCVSKCPTFSPGPRAPPNRNPRSPYMAKQPEAQTDASKMYRVTITTDRGPIVMDLDPQLAPNTVNNFIGLARQGSYDGLTWDRGVPGVVIQGGDPEGSGRGGPGYKFADEAVKGPDTPGAGPQAEAGPD